MDSTSTTPAPPSPLQEFWAYFQENRGAVAGLYIIIAITVVAVFAHIVAPYSPTEQFRDHLLQPPAWQEGGSWQFVLGTDAVGRDMLSRSIYGARVSQYIGRGVVSISLVVGIELGLLAGVVRGPVETVIIRVMVIILDIPRMYVE